MEVAQALTTFLLQSTIVQDLQGTTDTCMTISDLKQLLVDKLGERDAERFSDVHLQNLLAKEYVDESALQDATCEGLMSNPPLPAALVDKLLKAFGQSGKTVHLQ